MTDTFFKNEPEKQPDRLIPDLNDKTSNNKGKTDTDSGAFESEVDRMAAILSYIPFLCFIPLMNMRENKKIRFHARQGVMLFLIELVAVLFLIDGISNFVFKVILIAAVALSIAGIVFVLQGKDYHLPIISDLVDKTKL